MSRSGKIADTLIRLFNLLTFGVAALLLFSLCQVIYSDPELVKSLWDVLFIFLLLAVNGGIVWKSGRCLFIEPQQIQTSTLLIFWMLLMFIALMLIGIGMGSMGLGSSQ